MTNTQAIGQVLYTRYFFFFQAAGLILLVAEEADLIAHAAGAQVTDAQAGMNEVGKGQRSMEAAAGLDGHADDLAAPGIEPALAHQQMRDHRVEEAVVEHVVDVTVDVVVMPAGRDGAEEAIVGAPAGGGS